MSNVVKPSGFMLYVRYNIEGLWNHIRRIERYGSVATYKDIKMYTTPVSNFGKDHYDNLTDFLKDIYEIDCYQWLSPQHQEWVKDVIIKRFEDMEMSKMTDKLTPKSMKKQYDHQYDVFCRKNHDYGNSFEKSLDTFGLVAGIVRMNDKFERLVSLNDPSKDAQIASESLTDTLEDLSNYAAMAACWLKRKKERNWAKERLTAIKKEGVPVCRELEDTILKSVDDKIKAAEIYSRDKKSVDIESSKVIYKPQFTGIKLFGPKELELNLKEEIDQDKLFEISNALHPSNLPKSVKVDYGHKAVYEFPEGIDAISYYVREMQKEEAKKENDRVMLDMMLSRIEKGEVVRIVANGDGSFTTYFEKTEDKEDDREA